MERPAYDRIGRGYATSRRADPRIAAPVMQARAEALLFGDGSFDAVMAILSDHHWRDRAAGLREMRRVACERIVLLNFDPSLIERFWLTQDYLPGLRLAIATSA